MHDLPYLPRCISAPIVKMHEHVNKCSWHKNKAIKDKPKFNHVKGNKNNKQRTRTQIYKKGSKQRYNT